MKRYLVTSLFTTALAVSVCGCGSSGNPIQPEVPVFGPAPVTFADLKSRLARAQGSLAGTQYKQISDRLTREEGRPVTFSPTQIKVKLPPAEKQTLEKVTIHPLPAGLTARKVALMSLQQNLAARITDHMGLVYDAFIGEPYPGVLTKEEALQKMVVQEIYAGPQMSAYLVRTGFLDPQIAPDPDMFEATYTPAGRLLAAREVVGH